jgi:hypothetical protein
MEWYILTHTQITFLLNEIICHFTKSKKSLQHSCKMNYTYVALRSCPSLDVRIPETPASLYQ